MSRPAKERFSESIRFQSVKDPEPSHGVPPAADAGASRASAVVVVHGMGQQIPFETLDAVVDGLLRVHGRPQDAAATKAAVRLGRVGGVDQVRAELELQGAGGSKRTVHLYEAYWAPLTEGRVTLRDVLGFLWRAARNGRANAKAKDGFRRWMFGGWVQFTAQPATTRNLTLAWLVLATLVLVNFVTSAIFASAVLHRSGQSWVSPGLVADATVAIAALLAGVLVATVLLFATGRMGFLLLLLAVVIAGGGGQMAILLRHALAQPPIQPLVEAVWISSPWLVGGLWGLLFGASAWVRGKLVQYVGDVAAYVTPHRLDRFAALRQKIKQSVGEVVDAVYRHGADGLAEPYQRVILLGHSLGSVAAYDALNAVINKDRLSANGAWRVVERTSLLLTFGSPLDKTAFIFKAQGHNTGETREALAAAVQPLIQDYKFRTFPWINVWSPADIISGPLDFYDDRDHVPGGGQAVRNERDPLARTPLVAHTQYWDNEVVFRHLLAHLG